MAVCSLIWLIKVIIFLINLFKTSLKPFSIVKHIFFEAVFVWDEVVMFFAKLVVFAVGIKNLYAIVLIQKI